MPEPSLDSDRQAAEPPADVPSGFPDEPTRWRSEHLFGDRVEIEIEHGSAVYRLRKTALGKLILTK